ncbi:MAG TPA: TQO small subunit DoxD [Gemmatimonadales bacterium]|jgi:thiosulfate dehydrogenase [quinone] large subunit
MSSGPNDASAVRSPDHWLAVLRIVVGLWFLKGVLTKLSLTLAWGFLPVPTASERWLHTMPILIAKYADGNPIGVVKTFLEQTVLPHSAVFAHLTAFGEAAVGIGLTLGLLTPVAAALGLWLVLNYGFATQWLGFSQQGFHVILAACMIAFFFSRVGRTWGLDARLRNRWPESWMTRLT